MPLLGYVALFAALLGGRLATFATHLPTLPNAADAQLIVWILSWVAHALRHPPMLFEANINYPSPAQLTGSDYFLTCQLLFAPLRLLTGNAVLATNLSAFATYCLAGLACERLLRALGTGAAIAFIAGVLFALGPLRLPFNVHVLQYPNFFFPWIALATTRLRERPDVVRAALLAVAFACAAFTSLYTAVMVGVVGLLWAVSEALRPGPGRLRYLLLGMSAVAVAVAPLWLVLRVYLTRAQHQSLAIPHAPAGFPMLEFYASGSYVRLLLGTPEAFFALLAGVAVLALFAGMPLARRLVPIALALLIAGAVLSSSMAQLLGGTVAADVTRFMRYPHRFLTLCGFGVTILFAVGLSAVTTRLGRGFRALLVGAAFVVVLALHGLPLADGKPQEIVALGRDRAIHQQAAALIRSHGGGAMLVLPSYGFAAARAERTEILLPDAMLASTLHWLPLIDGYTGHQPGYRLLLSHSIDALPDEDALQDVIDITHLRWILLRPASAWPQESQRAAMQAKLLTSPSVGRAWDIGEWRLIELKRQPQHATWFDTLARGAADGATVLGTPLAPLPEAAAAGEVSLVGRLPATFAPGSLVPTRIRIRNAGTADWPATPAPDPGLILNIMIGVMPHSHSVMVIESWIPDDPARAADVARREQWIRRDVPAGESLAQNVLLVAPSEPGDYTLELRVMQIDGAHFDGPGNVAFRQQVRVVAPPAAKDPPRAEHTGGAS